MIYDGLYGSVLEIANRVSQNATWFHLQEPGFKECRKSVIKGNAMWVLRRVENLNAANKY